ncbi:MAG: hypothetical protein AB1726_17005 [Planctomycetota bacterium]
MYKPILAVATLSLTALGSDRSAPQPYLQLKEEAMYIEYAATTDQAVVIVEAESEEGLNRVEVQAPGGATVLRMQAGGGQLVSLSGFLVESRELDSSSLFASFAAGVYELRAETRDGQAVVGSAVFDHLLPPAPAVVYPYEGAEDVPTNLVVTWVPDRAVKAYRIVLEQNENDGLAVELPAGSNSFAVPDGILAPGTESMVEVGAIGTNGNITLVEISFTTW